MLPERVRIVEVGPRDGLQNEPGRVCVEDKVALVNALVTAGLQHVEVGSFVSPRWVPQMADSAAVFHAIERSPGVTYAALTPNLQGFEAAIEAGASEVAVFAAASESFSQRNINCSIAQSLQRFEPVLAAAARRGIKVRGYVSCVLGCPYEGEIAPAQVRDVASAMLQMGCYEISLGDTLGVGTPGAARRLIEVVAQRVPRAQLAGHFHDTHGQAVANIYACLLEGLQVFDSSVAGLGGCPYAPGASGNVATEDVLYLLHGLGIATGVDLAQVVRAGQSIMLALGRQSASRVARAHAGTAGPR
ncbi:hydroxymethylglutaryl-CoA lyase [Pseudomonas sp. CFBP 8770]|uniref:hydroxymethylglutaryl-CoA lyase n=1 Tax=unclassified Pseudomonas TaxID=196821 RepID=UPI001781369E|nr:MULTISPECIES: hydroxymethylglutaryl-CoA lyase [unclassified Pseudomonas]MBD8473094.1 hydroxymethylglutaryl-CoA lyase [Pseudomonas sp. CFBP 8773]MBD8645803.1 hydroxymethylglutaryl-CoA lyase [Pseudomonas sp. CFBP 8770]